MLAVNTSGERCEEVVTVNGVVFIPPVEKKKDMRNRPLRKIL